MYILTRLHVHQEVTTASLEEAELEVTQLREFKARTEGQLQALLSGQEQLAVATQELEVAQRQITETRAELE